MTNQPPFWEAAYQDAEAETFGPPAEELVELRPSLPPSARALDMGCGDGRNALWLAEQGVEVDAFDLSFAGIRKLRARSLEAGHRVRAWVQDLETFVFRREYDLIVIHGVLHLLERDAWGRVLEAARRHTKAGGWNVVVVFTDRLPPEAYTLEDEHPGGVRHRHPVNKIVARKVGALDLDE